jgi:hypothetical protein
LSVDPDPSVIRGPDRLQDSEQSLLLNGLQPLLKIVVQGIFRQRTVHTSRH